MNIIQYEEKRTLIKRLIKQDLNLTLVEIVILDKIATINKCSIEATELKQTLQSKNSPISTQLSNLIALGLLKKERDLHDERRIHLYDIQLTKINNLLLQFKKIVNKVTMPTQ